MNLMTKAKKRFARMIVDAIVKENPMSHTVEIKLLETTSWKVVEAKGIDFKKTNRKKGKRLCFKPGSYTNARQFKHMRNILNTLASEWLKHGACCSKYAKCFG